MSGNPGYNVENMMKNLRKKKQKEPTTFARLRKYLDYKDKDKSFVFDKAVEYLDSKYSTAFLIEGENLS